MPQAQRPSPYPAIPSESVQEGARWRHHRPTSEAVASWFATVPLDEGMDHADYVGGVVIIPQSEKVKYTKPDGSGTVERYEMTFTPYVQIGTRVAYFRHLAEQRELVPRIEPVEVPIIRDPASAYFNGNMAPGYWWHVVRGDSGQPIRFLCCTMRVALYAPATYGRKLRGEITEPVLSGEGTKQVSGGADPNALMKASTGAVGRALGVAGILVVGTGIASAEDVQEALGVAAPAPPAEPALPPSQAPGESAPEAPPADPAEELAALRACAIALQAEMQAQSPETWKEFAAWWQERSKTEGWADLGAVPFDALKGIVSKMERDLAGATANAQTGGGS